jgi:hypothetical protein
MKNVLVLKRKTLMKLTPVRVPGDEPKKFRTTGLPCLQIFPVC